MKIMTKQIVFALWARLVRQSAMWGRAVLPLGAAALCACLAHAAPAKIAHDLNTSAAGNVDVIVQYNQTPTAAHHQKVYSRGGAMKRDLGQFKGGAYTMPASQVESLASDPEVVYITPDRPIHATGTSSSNLAIDHHTEVIGASYAWAQGLNGAGVNVALIDSGIASVPDLTSTDIYAIASGSTTVLSAVSGTNSFFSADEFYSGGATLPSPVAQNVTGVANAAPGAVYMNYRYGTFTYTIPGLVPNVKYTVLLHFTEPYFNAAGQRVFNVAINGNTVLSNFDILKTAGRANVAVVEVFTAQANNQGQFVIAYTPGPANMPLSCGIEVRTIGPNILYSQD